MKHFKYIILIVLCGFTANTVSAQKGMQGVGGSIGLGYWVDLSVMDSFSERLNCNVSIKYQYNVSNYYRIEPMVLFKSYTDELYLNYFIALNNHIFLTRPKRLRPYLIGAIGYYYEGYYGYLDIRVGLGLDYRLNHKLSGQIACSFDTVSNQAQLEIGLAYNF